MDAINAHAANTGITAVLGSAASEIILTHSTGETIELSNLSVNSSTDGTIVLTALDKFGNAVTTKDTTLGRAANSATAKITLGNQATTGVKARGHVLGQMTLNSIKSFTVTGDDTTEEEGFFSTTQSYTGQTSSGGTAQLSAVSSISVADQEHATDAIAVLDAAIAKIDQQRADLGAVQNRFYHTISNLANIQENVSASRSRIQDTYFATETAEMTKNQILQQAGTSILSQANQLPQTALSLLG